MLGVERDATADDLKKSYRKLALKWHPDKNLDQVEEATQQFRLVQQAYDVLSDPQERAWYDKHREAILRGGQGRGGDYEDDCLDVYAYFNTACYSGYGDDEKGFYAVYRNVFKTLAEQDYEFMDDKDSDWEMPGFGNSQSDYDEVVGLFYGFWESFCTSRSYVWVEKYDTREAPNRRVRRLMEADNKKLRDAAKKERNEEIRALVAFVRKRDKRVQARKKKLEERAAEISRMTEARKEKHRQERIKMMENYKETEWSAMGHLEKDLKSLEANLAAEFGEEHSEDDSVTDEDGDDVGDEDDEYDSLFCVACNKAFKTDKAFMNHEKSKKHKENVQLLKDVMKDDEEEFMKNGENDDGDDDNIDDLDDITQDSGAKTKLSKKQKKKRKQLAQQNDDGTGDTVTDSMGNLNLEETECANKNQKLSKKEKRRLKQQREEEEGEEQDLPQPEVTDLHLANSEVTEPHVAESENTEKADDVPVVDTMNDGDQTEDHSVSDRKKEKTRGVSQPPQICNVCHKNFPTRNKLFQHIKESGHAVRIEQPTGNENSRNEKKKKKGKR